MKVYRSPGQVDRETKYYEFRQNNSGGSFDFDEDNGISHIVLMEAYDCEDANQRALGIGIYFGGEGDCPCCGNRWYENSGYRYDMVEEATLGDFIFEQMTQEYATHWMKKGNPEIFVHKIDGTLVGFWFDDETDASFLADRKEVKELEG